MTAVEQKLQGLKLDDDGEFRKCIDRFFDSKRNNDDVYVDMLRYSQNETTSQLLFDILEADLGRFMAALDPSESASAILVNILQFRPKPDSVYWGSQIMSYIKNYLKTCNVNNSVNWYLLIYLRLSTEFGLCFAEHLHVLLTWSIKSADIKAIALFIIVKALELDNHLCLEAIHAFLDYKLETHTSTDLFREFVQTLIVLFPIATSACVKIYTGKLCTRTIQDHVTKIDAGLPLSHKQTAQELLELVSAACIDELCRKYTADNYLQLLMEAKAVDVGPIRALGVLCIVKLWSFVSLQQEKSVTLEELYDITVQGLHIQGLDESGQEYCIETLAYLTLSASVRIKLRQDEDIIDLLVAMVSDNAKMYGILLIMSNLTKVDTNSQAKATRELKTMAMAGSKQDHEEPHDIYNLNRSLIMDHKLLTRIAEHPRHANTNTTIQVIIIIYQMSLNQAKLARQELAKQGALTTLMDYLVRLKKSNDEVRTKAIQALAKILVMVDPNLALKKYDIITCIPFLEELLQPSTTFFDKYESLLSLTNISSMERDDIKDYMVRLFDMELDTFIIDTDHPEIHKASWELVSNIILRPRVLAKFFNADPKAARRLELLIKLLNLTDPELQILLAGVLANATSEFDMIAQMLGDHLELRDVIIDIFSTQSEPELILRLCLVLLDLVYANVNRSFFDKELKLVLETVAQSENHKKSQVREIVAEILKMI